MQLFLPSGRLDLPVAAAGAF